MSASEFRTGQPVLAEVYDGEWFPATVIGTRTRANGQVFYRLSVKQAEGTPWLSAKRLRPAPAPDFDPAIDYPERRGLPV